MPLVLWNKTLKPFTQEEIDRKVSEIVAAGETVLSIAVPPSAPEYKDIGEIPILRQTGILIQEVFVYTGSEAGWSKTVDQMALIKKVAENLAKNDTSDASSPKKRGRPSMRPAIESMKRLIESAEEGKKKRKNARKEKFLPIASDPFGEATVQSGVSESLTVESTSSNSTVINTGEKRKRGRPRKGSSSVGA